MTSFKITAALFDNDGVLVDSHHAAEIAWNQWASEYQPGFSFPLAFHGRRASDIVLDVIGEELFEIANDRINFLEQETAGLTIALPGAVELTQAIPAGFWTVCTSANSNLGRARLLAAGIEIPDALVTADDVERGKPHPDPYLLGAQRLGIAPEDCVVFEDAPAGIAAGAAAGAGLLVGVGERILESDVAVVIKSLSGIQWLQGELIIPDEIRLR